jgi:hypothetical protein
LIEPPTRSSPCSPPAANTELRSSAIEERHLDFESRAYFITLTIETAGVSLKAVIGQISRKPEEPPGPEPTGVPAELRVSGKAYRTEVTEFGEFLFRVNEQLDGNPIELRFEMKEEPCLAVLIPC